MAMILVADDDNSVREVLVKIVRSLGHDALLARNGVEAVALFRSCPDLIDVVITDLNMPVMSGNEATRRIRETKPDAVIICVSGCSAEECPAGAMFLSKPFTFEQVRTRLSEALTVDSPAPL